MRSSMVPLLLAVCSCAPGPRTQVDQDPPPDRPLSVATPEAFAHLDSLLQPHIAQARATYPEARRRYLSGLPPGHTFFVTIKLHDNVGRGEMVFIAVDSLVQETAFGRIWNEIMTVSGYKLGQAHSVPETEILDWTISRPDGTEEGNFVGQFIDTLYQ
jgi:hypothetical protein